MFFRKDRKEDMKKILEVPYISQNSQDVPEEWRDSVCGIACIKMILQYINKESDSMTDLIREGEIISGFSKNGWLHDALIRIMRNRNVMCYSQEFRSVNIMIDDVNGVTRSEGLNEEFLNKSGINKIIKKIKDNLPVIVSVKEGFDGNKHTHMIVLTGFDLDRQNQVFFYNNPDSRDGIEKNNHQMKIAYFLKYWRKFAIFLDNN